MSVTYTTAAERDNARLWREARHGWPPPLLTVTSCVAVLAIALACVGRLRALDESQLAGGPVVNLNTVRDAQRWSLRSAPRSRTRTTAGWQRPSCSDS